MKMKSGSMAYCVMALLLLFGAFLLTGCGATVYETVADLGRTASSGDSGVSGAAGAAEESGSSGGEPFPEMKTVCVYVCGAVMRSGVYELPEDARVFEAIAAAGGLMPDADETALNQAEVVSDGQQITVLTKEQTAHLQTGNAAAIGSTAPAKVNINTADAEELMTLRGIGAAKAADIVAYREQNGPFGAIEDIMKVSGIKTALFEKIRDGITVG